MDTFLMKPFLAQVIELGVKTQRTAWNQGDENQGASIDIMAYILKKYDNRRTANEHGIAAELVSDIKIWDGINNEALKYAKPIAQVTQRAIANAVQSYTKGE